MAISESLSLILNAVGADKLVAALGATGESAATAGLAEQKRAAATLAAAAADDKATLAASRLRLELATQAGTGGSGSAAALALTSAQNTSKVSALEASVAQKTLTADTLAASAGTKVAATEATGLSGALGKVGLGAGVASSALTPMVAIMAAGAIAKYAMDGVAAWVRLTDEVRTFSQVTGASAETSSLFIGQMNALGVDSSAADKAMLKFATTIGTGKDKLADYGIEIARNADGTVNMIGTLENVRVAYQGTTDASAKAAISSQISLRAGTALLPILNATGAQIQSINQATRDAHSVVTDKDLNSAKQYTIAVNQMKDSFASLSRSVAGAMVPALTDLAGGLTLIMNDLQKLQGWQEPGWLKTVTGWNLVHHDAPKEDVKPTAVLGPGSLDYLAKQASGLPTDTAGQSDALQSSLTASVSASDSLASAQDAVAAATKTHNDALTAQATLIKDGVTGYSEYETALKGVTSAQKTYTDAVAAQTAAQDDLNTARKASTALEMEAANLKVATAGDKIVSAQQAQQTAQEKLNALVGSGAASADEIAAARQAVVAAGHAVTGAQVDQGNAGLDVVTAQRKGTEADPAVQAAEQKVTAARVASKAALDGVNTSQVAVNKAVADYGTALLTAQALVDSTQADIVSKQKTVETATLSAKDAADKLSTTIGNTSGVAYDVLKDKLDTGLTPSLEASLVAAQALQSVMTMSGPPGYDPTSPGGSSWTETSPGNVALAGKRITPNSQSAGGSNVNVTVNATTGATSKAIARDVSWALLTV